MQEKRLIPVKLKFQKFLQQGRIYSRFNKIALTEMNVRIVELLFIIGQIFYGNKDTNQPNQ